MDNGLSIVYNEETGLWEEKPEPFAVVEYLTEEDFKFVETAVEHYKKHRWISVKDRLPENFGWYVTWNGEKISFTWFNSDKDWECTVFPTHWMPLPEPPEEE